MPLAQNPVLYYPPINGRRGANPDDWPGGMMPGDLGAAIDLSQIALSQLIDSNTFEAITDENLQVIKQVNRDAPIWDNGRLTIPITGGSEAPAPVYQQSWMQKNWPFIALGGLAVLILLLPRR